MNMNMYNKTFALDKAELTEGKEEPGVPEGVKLAAIAYNKYGALHPNRPINQLYQRNI